MKETTVQVKNGRVIGTETVVLYKETYVNNTKILQKVYDCFGEGFDVEPGKSVVLTQRRRGQRNIEVETESVKKPINEDKIIREEEPNGPDKSKFTKQGAGSVRQPESKPTSRTGRRFNRI